MDEQPQESKLEQVVEEKVPEADEKLPEMDERLPVVAEKEKEEDKDLFEAPEPSPFETAQDAEANPDNKDANNETPGAKDDDTTVVARKIGGGGKNRRGKK